VFKIVHSESYQIRGPKEIYTHAHVQDSSSSSESTYTAPVAYYK